MTKSRKQFLEHITKLRKLLKILFSMLSILQIVEEKTQKLQISDYLLYLMNRQKFQHDFWILTTLSISQDNYQKMEVRTTTNGGIEKFQRIKY